MEAPASGSAQAWRVRRDADVEALMTAASPAVSHLRPRHLGEDNDAEWQLMLRRAAQAAMQAAAARSSQCRVPTTPTVADVTKRLLKQLRHPKQLVVPRPQHLRTHGDGVVDAIDALLGDDLDPSRLTLKVGPRRGLSRRQKERGASGHSRPLAADLRDEKRRRVAVLLPATSQEGGAVEATQAAFQTALEPGSAALSTVTQIRKLRKLLPPMWRVYSSTDGLVFYNISDNSFTHHNPLQRVENESLTASNLYAPTTPPRSHHTPVPLNPRAHSRWPRLNTYGVGDGLRRTRCTSAVPVPHGRSAGRPRGVLAVRGRSSGRVEHRRRRHGDASTVLSRRVSATQAATIAIAVYVCGPRPPR